MQKIEYGVPQQSGLTKDSVNMLAESVASQLKYKPGDALEPVVASLGGRIEYQDLWEMEASSSGSIQIQKHGDFVIYLASHTGPLRDRFTIAHELGHYVLHFLYPESRGRRIGPIQAQRYGTGPVEWEANWFAAGLLMPSESFKKVFKQSDGDLIEVAKKFGVSVQAADIRTKFLGL